MNIAPHVEVMNHSLFRRGVATLAAATAILAFTAGPLCAEIDEGKTKEVWRLKYGVSAAQAENSGWLSQDTDGDGATNAEELAGGTNPFSPSTTIRVSKVALNGGNAELTFPTEAGKRYQAERTASLTTPNYAAVGAVVAGTGGAVMISVTHSNAQYYRIRVFDADTDGDGLADWLEQATGLNPNTPWVGGNPDLTEYNYVASELAQPCEVNIRATSAFASEDGPTAGTFTVTRSQKLLPLTVNYTTSGTATAGLDYSALSGSITFLAGADTPSAPFTVNPLQNIPSTEGSESVTVTLTAPGGPDPAYVVGANSSATVIIGETTAPTGTGLTARYYDNLGVAKTYTFVRNTTTSGVATIAHTGAPTLAQGDVVTIQFTAGNMNTGPFNVLNNYVVSNVTGTNFTVPINGTSLPASQTSAAACLVNYPRYNPTPTVQRVDATVDNDWLVGTPNGNSIAVGTNTSGNPTDNWSSFWEGYLHPTTEGNYQFQLDGDDKARVLVDLNRNGTFDLPTEQIVEHGWDTSSTVSPGDGVADNETIGTFKPSAAHALVVPAGASERYKIRVEMVEGTDAARCRLQWRSGTNAYANIAQANVFTHTSAMTYSYTRGGNAPNYTGSVVVTLNGHGYSANNPVDVSFSSGNLFLPGNGNYHGTYTIASTTTNTFTVSLPGGAGLPSNGTGNGFVLARPASTTTGWYNLVYTNTGFTAPVGRVGVNSNGTNDYNNGIYGTGTPDPTLINPETFHARWTGQVQPQFTEEYTFVVLADDGTSLRINGEVQEMRSVPATNSAVGTYAYNSTTGDVVVTYSSAVIKPNSFVVGEPVRLDPSSGNLTHGNGSTYTFDGVTGIATITYSNLTNIIAGGFIDGEILELDPTNGSLTSLALLPYTISNVTDTTFDIQIGTGLFDSGSGSVNISDNRNALVTAVSAPGAWPTTFTFHIGTGKYNTGTGNVNVEIVNRSLKEWAVMTSERYCRIPMVAGARYDIQLDYWDNTSTARCRLFWFSPSQPKQIIPSDRLYPESATQAPPVHLTGTDTTILVGDQVSIPIDVSNGGTVTISGNPAWLTYANGVLSSNGAIPPGAAGVYQILVTITNAAGTSTSVINVRVEDTGGHIAREYWDGVFASLADIPTHTPPAGSENLSSLSAQDAGDNFGTRIRGYVTAPATGNYYFYVAASSAAELWISNDDDPINAFKRAWVATGSGPQNWTAEPNQKSAWLALEQGKKYYIEVLARALTGSDHLAVGWIKPGQSTVAVLPGHVLSNYVPSTSGSASGTLYVSTLLSQNGAVTNGVGSSTLRLSEDETVAYMRYSYSGLTGPITSQHIHIDPNPGHNDGEIVFDIDTPETPGDGLITNQNDPNFGAYKWTINPIGTYGEPADIVNAIKSGKAYINLHTAAYPAGEIRGNYTLAIGSRHFTPPPPPPATWVDDSNTATGAARFLTQATYGPSIGDINALIALPATSSSGLYPASRYETWIDNQFALSESSNSHHLNEVLRTENASAQGGAWDESLFFNSWWYNAMSGPDQLRQRVAFALSEIHVISAQGPLDNEARSLAYFYDTLVDNAFGNFRQILGDTTLTPGMGRYLDMLRNDKPDQTIGRIPNENYAREIKQLFSIGLFRMWPDGTLMLSANDTPIDTYKQPEIIGFAHVFTGWDYGYDGAYRTTLGAATTWVRPMREVPARHYTGPKRLLNNEVLPGLSDLGGHPLDPIATHTANLYNNAAYQQLPQQELDYAHDQLFNHSNTGPFICRQLIQRLVASHPSRDYLYRVVQKFNDNGAGVRGDMKAVLKAILLDYEARHPAVVDDLSYGKQRETLLRISAAGRAFRIAPWQGTYSQSGTQTITVTLNAGEPSHRLENGDNIFLNFTSGDPAPWIGSYAVSGVTATTFNIAAQGWATGNYSIGASSNVCRITMNNHWLQIGQQVYVDFTGGSPADGDSGLDTTVYTLTNASAQTGSGSSSFFEFQIAAGEVSATARSGTVMIPRFTPGSFTTRASGLAAPNDRSVTMDTNVAHHLKVGDQVQLNFTGGNPQPVDMVVTVDSVVDLNTWTFTASGTGTNLGTNQGNNSVYQFPLVSQPLNRSGTVGNRPSTYAMNNTTADLEQAPLYSPTVFNFYLPDYKFPGPLASQGLTTPEFQTTAETTVVRQVNYIYNGIFGETNTNGISSFNNGNHALVLDFFPWYGNATTDGLGVGPQTGMPWTHNQNLSTLIDHMSTLLVGGQLSSAVKTRIRNFIATPVTAVSQHATNPCIFTTSVPHNFNVGESVVVSGITGGTFSPSVNSTSTARTIASVPSATTFTLTGQTCTNNSSVNFSNGHVSVVQYNQGSTTPSTTNKRDRLRTLIHLILTSPDFTIQR